jgi:GT2 family glycosyltransferase/glycosyltransferase involved in cell wall biosynthesis
MKSVDIIIPVHNNVYWLSSCLEEVFRFKFSALKNVIVVNDRTDKEEFVKLHEIISCYPKIKFINNQSKSGGFGFACNLGAENAKSDLLLFLNTDCLVTKNVVDKLASVFDFDDSIALVCPLSNNSPNLTLPMIPGFSYQNMATLLDNLTKSLDPKDYIFEACTVVGNCLMVRRDFFESVKGFSSEWGIGYGEETDLQMKALAMGQKGVVNLSCYVYHFGGGTFNNIDKIEIHRQNNYKKFMKKWSIEYSSLLKRCSSKDPVNHIYKILKNSNIANPQCLDVLFYLPAINQTVGGINVAISICNELIVNNINAACVIIGPYDRSTLSSYLEPLLFEPIFFRSDEDFIHNDIIESKFVVSTIAHSSFAVNQFCKLRNATHLQFIQGYEGYFNNGVNFNSVIESYKLGDQLITTSDWLHRQVSQTSKIKSIKKIPIAINSNIFFESDSLKKDIDILFVLRNSPDKGQWIILQILHILSNDHSLNITVMLDDNYKKVELYYPKIKFILLPLDAYNISKFFRRTKIFFDASLHEGFGLMPYEALNCGCYLICSNSGGISDYCNKSNSHIFSINADPHFLIDIIYSKLKSYKNSRKYLISPKNVAYWSEFIKKALIQNKNKKLKKYNKSPTKTFLILLKNFYLKFVKPRISHKLHLFIKKVIYDE